MGEQHWDVEADVVVLGSGGAALMAALAAHASRRRRCGHSRESPAWSAAPRPCLAGCCGSRSTIIKPEQGIEDSFDEVVTYLDAMAPEMLDPDAARGIPRRRP